MSLLEEAVKQSWVDKSESEEGVGKSRIQDSSTCLPRAILHVDKAADHQDNVRFLQEEDGAIPEDVRFQVHFPRVDLPHAECTAGHNCEAQDIKWDRYHEKEQRVEVWKNPN